MNLHILPTAVNFCAYLVRNQKSLNIYVPSFSEFYIQRKNPLLSALTLSVPRLDASSF